ncbi:sesquipedalian-2 isoform X2 [Elephas maximus indicus]|uniref:sesquipedalian-2 isoform X2 n=1 Tax=Elephas maximus indicus TaxID=99487 RepID=UPI002117175A|nr:sesquipedalian-2 isoform X2 [Elephas maximus indicus]
MRPPITAEEGGRGADSGSPGGGLGAWDGGSRAAQCGTLGSGRSPPSQPQFPSREGRLRGSEAWVTGAASLSDPWPPLSPHSSSRASPAGAMKLNERSVAHYALSDSPADHTGFLRTWGGPGTPPTPSGAGRRCWFVLKGNLLFSFESREGRAPLSLVVLEGCTVELAEAPVPEEFAFAIRFDAPGVRPHLLAADGPAAQEAWVKALSRASFGYMRLVVRELEGQLRDARQTLALHRRSSQKTGTSRYKPQAPDLCSPGLENGHFPSKDCSPVGMAEEGGSRPAGWASAEWEFQGPASLLLGRGQSPVSPETSCFSTLHDWYGQEIVELRRGWLQRARGGQAECEKKDRP